MRNRARARRGGLIVASTVVGGFVLASGHDAVAQSASVKRCAAAFEAVQEHREKGQLSTARTEALLCGSAPCPAPMRRDCAQWLSEIDVAMPGAVFTVHGASFSEVRVRIDKGSAEPLRSTDVPLDPGTHHVHAEAPGRPPIDREIHLVEGEKHAKVELDFDPATSGAPSSLGANDAGSKAIAPAPADGSERKTMGPLFWVTGAVGVAAAVTSAAFGGLGLAERGTLEDTCNSRGCTEADKDSVRAKFLISDIALGTAVVGLGAAVVLYLVAPTRARKTASSALTIDAPARAAGGWIVRW